MIPFIQAFPALNMKYVWGGLSILAILIILILGVRDWLSVREDLALEKSKRVEVERTLRVTRARYQVQITALEEQRRAHALLLEEVREFENELSEDIQSHDRPVGPVLQRVYDRMREQHGR